MGSESPNAILYDYQGNELALQNGAAIPANTPLLMIGGTDGTNSRYFLIDSSGRLVVVGSATDNTANSTTKLPVMAAVANTSAPSYTSGNMVPLSTDTSGNLRVTGTFTSSGASDTTATGTLNALNATVQITLAGQNNAAMTLETGTLVGTIVAEVSTDAGTTWVSSFFDDPTTGNITSSIVFGSANTATVRTIVGVGGAGLARIRVSAFTSGTATCNLRASVMQDPSLLSGGAAGAVLPPVIQQIGASVTTASPTYTTGTLNALSLTTAGALRIDGSAVTQPVSGTVTANQGTSPWVTNITQFGGSAIVTGTGTSGAGIPRVTVSNDSNILATQSGTWTVQPGNTANTTPWLVTDSADGPVTPGAVAGKSMLIGGQFNTALPTLTNTQQSSIQLDSSGRVIISSLPTGANTIGAVTQGTSPWVDNISQFGGSAVVTGTGASGAGIPRVTVANDSNILATQSGTWTVAQGTAAALAGAWPQKLTDGTNGPVAVKAASTAPAATDPALVVVMSPNSPSLNDSTATGALGALNATVSISMAGQRTAGFQLAAGTLIGTIVAEVSFDGGTTWNATYIDTGNKLSSIVFASANAATAGSIVGEGGSGQIRVRVSAYTSGTANITLRSSDVDDPSVLYAGLPAAAVQPPTLAQVGGWDGANLRALLVDTSGRPNIVGAAAAGAAVAGNPVQVGGKDPSGNAQPIALAAEQSQYITPAPNKQTVQSNATITATGSQIFTTYGSKEVDLFINIKNAPTGTTPTITWSLQEIDPGDGTTSSGSLVTGTAMTAAGVQTITLPVTKSPTIKVTWTVTGTTPSFTGVYATLVSKISGNVQLYDSTGTAVSGSNPLTITFSSPTGAAISFGDVSLASVTTAAVERTTYTEQSANFTGSIVSSNANDTAAGTGARTITIVYIDSTGATQTTSTYSMNGTTAVNLSASNMCFIESITVATVGSTGSNVGTISLFTGTGGTGTLVGTIAATDNRTFWAHHYVLTGKTCKIQGTVLGSTSTTVGAGNIGFIKQKSLINANQPETQVTDILTLYGQSSMTTRNYTTAIPIAAGPSRVRAYVTTQSSTSQTYRFSFDYIDQ